ncbi:hypothetical protein AX17_000111 [Amanita inopinata Kibby_2008]|nr:hypothetical protein AX17_000111 [Amanita inopinata Kibby_2008]
MAADTSDEDIINNVLHPDDPTAHDSQASDAPARSAALVNSIVTASIDVFRPYAPQIIPVFVCTLLIPVLVALSTLAGWLVWKSPSVGWESPLYLQYGDGLQPYAQVSLPLLVPQQRYDISVQVIAPLIESNLALGNFMASLTLSTPANKTLVSVRRPTMILPPKSSLFSRKPNTIMLEVQLLQSYLVGTPKLVASVEFGRKDSWASIGKGEGREVSVLAAHIRGTVVHHGIRGLVSRFPLASALLSAMGFFTMISFILGACILPNIIQRQGEQEPVALSYQPVKKQRTISSSDISISDDGGPRSRGRRTRRPKPSRSSSEHVKLEVEEPVDSIPSARLKSEPLRRRPSRRTERQSDSDS